MGMRSRGVGNGELGGRAYRKGRLSIWVFWPFPIQIRWRVCRIPLVGLNLLRASIELVRL